MAGFFIYSKKIIPNKGLRIKRVFFPAYVLILTP